MFSRHRTYTATRIAVFVAVLALVTSACSGGSNDSAERDRNASTATKVMSCSKAGEVKTIAGRRMVCGQSTMTKNAPKQWFLVAAQKKWVCKKRGIPRYLNGVLSICGTVKKKTFWHTTVAATAVSPISASAESATSTIVAAQSSTTVAAQSESTSGTISPIGGSPIVRESAPTATTMPVGTSPTVISAGPTSTTSAVSVAPPTTTPTPAPVLQIGDTGPGGGIVFLTPTSDGNLTGKYFEAAPVTWYSTFGCTDASAAELNTQTEIGQGLTNTSRIIAACGGGTSTAAGLANAMTYAGLTDWVLPSINELQAMYAARGKATCKSKCSNAFGTGAYWSSTIQIDKEPVTVNFSASGTLAGLSLELDRTTGAFVRAVRSFS